METNNMKLHMSMIRFMDWQSGGILMEINHLKPHLKTQYDTV